MDSILNTVKKLLGISEYDDSFDTDLIIHINSVFTILNQLGVGPEEGYSISDNNNTWDEFIPASGPLMEAVKSYVYLKVRLGFFDPPTSSAVINALNSSINELEFRLKVLVETY